MGLEWPTGEGKRGPGPGRPNGGAEEGARRAGSPKLVSPGCADGLAGGLRARPGAGVRAGLIELRREGGAGGKGRGSG